MDIEIAVARLGSQFSSHHQELCWKLQQHGLLRSPEAILAYQRVDHGDFVTGGGFEKGRVLQAKIHDKKHGLV